jgi:hypothetical protein
VLRYGMPAVVLIRFDAKIIEKSFDASQLGEGGGGRVDGGGGGGRAGGGTQYAKEAEETEGDTLRCRRDCHLTSTTEVR